jgi:hypothetical protein
VNPDAPVFTPVGRQDGGLTSDAAAATQNPPSRSIAGGESKQNEAPRENVESSRKDDVPPSQPSPSRRHHQEPRHVIHGTRRDSSRHPQGPQLGQRAPLSDDDGNNSDGRLLLPEESEKGVQMADIEDVPPALLQGRRRGVMAGRSDNGPGTEAGASVRSPRGRGVSSRDALSGSGKSAASDASTGQKSADGDLQ